MDLCKTVTKIRYTEFSQSRTQTVNLGRHF